MYSILRQKSTPTVKNTSTPEKPSLDSNSSSNSSSLKDTEPKTKAEPSLVRSLSEPIQSTHSDIDNINTSPPPTKKHVSSSKAASSRFLKYQPRSHRKEKTILKSPSRSWNDIIFNPSQQESWWRWVIFKFGLFFSISTYLIYRFPSEKFRSKPIIDTSISDVISGYLEKLPYYQTMVNWINDTIDSLFGTNFK